MALEQQQWDLDQTGPIRPQLHRILRERIVRNDLVPGSQISEAEIARTYGISRQPVREAFIKLAEEGLIAIRPQRGTIVKKIACNSVLDARFVREAIEADIVKLLAEQQNASLILDLRGQLEKQKKVGNDAPQNFISLDECFHRTLAGAAGKANAWKFVEGLKSQMDRVRYLSLSQFPVNKLIRQHTEIVDSIEHGDISAAETAIRQHLREILSDLPQVHGENPNFFDGTSPDELTNKPHTT